MYIRFTSAASRSFVYEYMHVSLQCTRKFVYVYACMYDACMYVGNLSVLITHCFYHNSQMLKVAPRAATISGGLQVRYAQECWAEHKMPKLFTGDMHPALPAYTTDLT